MPFRNNTNYRSSTKRVKVVGAIAYPNLIALIGEGDPMAHARAVGSREPAQAPFGHRAGQDGAPHAGLTAYGGLRAIGKPAPRETVGS